jgi:hypothetical protein
MLKGAGLQFGILTARGAMRVGRTGTEAAAKYAPDDAAPTNYHARIVRLYPTT